MKLCEGKVSLAKSFLASEVVALLTRSVPGQTLLIGREIL